MDVFVSKDIKIKNIDKLKEILQNCLVFYNDEEEIGESQGVELDFNKFENTYSFGDYSCLLGYFNDDILDKKYKVQLYENEEIYLNEEEYELFKQEISEAEEKAYDLMCEKISHILKDNETIIIHSLSQEKLYYLNSDITIIKKDKYIFKTMNDFQQELINTI